MSLPIFLRCHSTAYYFRATSMALSGLVGMFAHCYCADREIDVPPLKINWPNRLGGVL
jgi:hypothetical protein